MSTNIGSTTTSREPTTSQDRRFVQVIDLYTQEPAELERLLNQWRSTSLAREHISEVDVARGDDEDGHLVLEVQYEPIPEPTTPAERSVEAPDVSPIEAASPEAVAVVALLDRPPRFRPSSG